MTYNPERGNVDLLQTVPPSVVASWESTSPSQDTVTTKNGTEHHTLVRFAQVFKHLDDEIRNGKCTSRHISLKLAERFRSVAEELLLAPEEELFARPSTSLRLTDRQEDHSVNLTLEDGWRGEKPSAGSPASIVLKDIVEEMEKGRTGRPTYTGPDNVHRLRLAHLKERQLWDLLFILLEDESHAAGKLHDPEALGLFRIQPHRRWYTSQYAYLQDFLFRFPFFRKATLIVRWLEKTFRERQTLEQDPASLQYIQDENFHLKLRVRGSDELSLRQLILSRIRGGEMCEALKDAFVNKHCPYCCLLCATQLQTVREPWWAATGAVKEVPLFGEYTSSDLSDKYVWAGNECRLETLGLLYEATVREDHPFTATTIPRDTDAASERLDTTVAAVLCGNWELLNRQKTFSSSWTDTVWSYLRCSLVVAFTHYLRCCQVPVPEAYADYVARKVQETPQRWEEHYAQEVWKGLTALLEPFLTTTSLVEQLQIRSLLQVLQPSQKWLNVRPRERDATAEETRLITLVLLLFNQAGRDELCGKAAMCTTPGDLNYCVTRYTYKLAELHRHDVFEGMRLAIVMAKQLHDHTGRAQAYATYIVCVRQYEYVRQVMNREAVESQEGRLVRLFLEADPDRRAVGRQVQGLLSDTVPTDTLLTRNPLAERILWEAMHAQTLEDHGAVLRHGVDACVQFWLDPQGPLLEAIHDVSGILYREVLLRYTGPRKIDQVLNYPTLPADRIGEAEFWHTFSKCCRLSVSHITAATEMSALRAHAAGSLYDSDRAKVYELSQTEHSLLEGLTQHVGEALLNARAVVHRHAGCAGVIVHLLTIYLESAVMALQARPLEDEGDLGVLQCAASCVNCTHKEEIYFQNKPFEEDRKDQHYRRPHGEEEVLYRSTARRVDPIALQPVMRLFAQLHLACLERQHRREVQGILIERERN